ncbi:MAG: glyoxalase [Saprospiraceae bacterium]|nr:glyoxalase [Saprospiraceae bacterium]
MLQINTMGIMRTFVPSLDYETEKQFYKDIGFQLGWEGDDMCVMHAGEQSFYLQRYYIKDWADNFMMFLEVKDVDKWYAHLIDQNLKEQYEGVKMTEPVNEFWGKVCRLITPTGVLWHFGTFAEADN